MEPVCFLYFFSHFPPTTSRVISKHTKARRVVFEPETSGVSEVRGAGKF